MDFEFDEKMPPEFCCLIEMKVLCWFPRLFKVFFFVDSAAPDAVFFVLPTLGELSWFGSIYF